MTTNYLTKLNNLYGKVDLKSLASKMFQDETNAGYAILSIFENTGIAGFKFHVPEREQVTFQSDVTDHYIEDNSPVQDHIALKPIEITLQGYQGEYFYPVQKYEAAIATVIPTLNLVSQFLPDVMNITKQVKNVKLAYESEKLTKLNLYNSATSNLSPIEASILGATDVNSISGAIQNVSTPLSLKQKASILWGATKYNLNATDLFNTFQDLYKLKSAQTRAFLFFESLWHSKRYFTVETSWKRYDNMVITNVTPVRDNNADITDFKVTLKQLSFTQTKTVTIKAAGRTQQQLAKEVDKGTDKGLKTNV